MALDLNKPPDEEEAVDLPDLNEEVPDEELQVPGEEQVEVHHMLEDEQVVNQIGAGANHVVHPFDLNVTGPEQHEGNYPDEGDDLQAIHDNILSEHEGFYDDDAELLHDLSMMEEDLQDYVVYA